VADIQPLDRWAGPPAFAERHGLVLPDRPPGTGRNFLRCTAPWGVFVFLGMNPVGFFPGPSVRRLKLNGTAVVPEIQEANRPIDNLRVAACCAI